MQKSLLIAVFAGICGSASAADATTPLTLPSADMKGAITLQLPEGSKTYLSKDGSTTIDVPMSGIHIQIWALSHASLDEASKQVADLIKGQVSQFKITESKSIRVAGTVGQQLTGTGEEADDGDPSNAEVYLFSVEGKVFMICAHGEGDISVKKRALLNAFLESVKKTCT